MNQKYVANILINVLVVKAGTYSEYRFSFSGKSIRTPMPTAAAAVFNGLPQRRTAVAAVGIGVRIDFSEKEKRYLGYTRSDFGFRNIYGASKTMTLKPKTMRATFDPPMTP